jgi:hypothetical protein
MLLGLSIVYILLMTGYITVSRDIEHIEKSYIYIPHLINTQMLLLLTSSDSSIFHAYAVGANQSG